ncbi:serpin-ZX-like [Prunus yedoensis var. nudiflora]|uniref:Serpin-ZX-like n=1 Tax=Prunus yedoensis var. nudiflora TaxID=2094558 RepID=A0A314XWM5_PRUYE|nr:serpin-ZX-like [Prunus yedoensis var. nudiflora]
MTIYKRQFISAFDGFKVLKLPYKQAYDEKRRFLDRHIPYFRDEVGIVKIPKFKITSWFEVWGILKQLGLKLPFNMTEMVEAPPGQDLSVSKMLQKAVIEVNEEGTEAAAVTVTSASFSLAAWEPRKKIDFVADHPFLFLIREEMTGAVLFIGQLLNPLQG